MTQASVIHSLEIVRRRVRWLSVALGAGWVAALCVSLLLLLVALDYLLNLPALPRCILMLGAAVAAGYSAWRWIVRPLLSQISLNAVAGRIERTFPQYQDRLRSTVDILTGKTLPGSEVMKQRVVSETTRLTQGLDLRAAVITRPVIWSTACGVAAMLLLAILAGSVQRDLLHTASRRLFAPFSAMPWPRSVLIQQVGILPHSLAVGQRLDVDIRLSRGDRATRKAVIFYQYTDATGRISGPVGQEYMKRGSDGVYHAAIDAVVPPGTDAGLLKVWMESGDDRVELPPVKIVQRLGISRVEAVITPPSYANQPPVRVNLSQNPAAMTAGSKLELIATFSKPLNPKEPVAVQVLTPNAKPSFHWQPIDDNTAAAIVDATESFRFRLQATDLDGFTNPAAEEFEIAVQPDRLPTVEFENPRSNLDRTPDAVIPVQLLAEDDFGIDSLLLEIDRLGDKKHWEIPLVRSAAALPGIRWEHVDSSSDLQRFRAGWSFDLAQLPDAKLKPGDVLECAAMVKDNYLYNGASHPPVASGKVRVSIISQEEFNNKVMDELSAAAEQAKSLLAAQASTQHETGELAKQLASKATLDDADRAAANRLVDQQRTIASQTKSVAQNLSELQSLMRENNSSNQELKDIAKEDGDLLNRTAESPMKSASGNLENLRDNADPRARAQAVADAQENQTTAAESLQKAVDQMGTIGSLSRTMESVQHLLDQQQKLSQATADSGKETRGKSLAELTDAQRQQLADLAKQQAALADATAKVQKQMGKDADRLSKSDPTAAAAMRKAAGTGKLANVPGEQKKAAEAVSQNQQGQAAAEQKKAQEGMEKMLDNLQEAQEKKLEALAARLANAQTQIAALVREQAGINLDNLSLQGGDVLSRLDAPTRADLFTDAERDPNVSIPPIEIGTLASSQEQTLSNTKAIAKTVTGLSQGAELADHLTDAADKMERAVSSLREGNLPQAYDPTQTQALESLRLARSLVQQQKDAVDQQQEQKKKDSVREAYETLLEEQNGLNTRTLAINESPRNDDGSLPRASMLEVSRLSVEQAKLADTAAAMSTDLSALGSIVYTFANQNLVNDMHQVHDRLSQAQTDQVTQLVQAQVAAELEALIRDLKIKPKEPGFEEQPKKQKPGGGGGGPTPPDAMPTEAEFRLLKDLQLAENSATTAAGKNTAPGKPVLLALAKRQGDLREILDQLIRKSTKGEAKLPPEPEFEDQQPAPPGQAIESVDNQELQGDLLAPGRPKATTQASADKTPGGVRVLADRMARARHQLAALNDAGPVTQEIQSRIVGDLDQLIQAARQKQPPPPPPSKPKPTSQPSPKEKEKPKPSSGAQPDNSDSKGTPKPTQTKPGTDHSQPGEFKPPQANDNQSQQSNRMWGDVTPRQRDAIIESQNEKIIEKYKDIVDDYYRAMSKPASDDRP
jgi:hypothetical protein